MVWVARVITAAMPAIGARTRPASMLAATSAPTDSLPSRIRNTPTMTSSRLVICCAALALVSASDAQKCTSSPERAVAATERSHAVCMRASPPTARTVSMPDSDSTSTPWRAADSACRRRMARSSGRCITRPTAIMIGSITSGIQASGPAMMNSTTMNRIANSRSVADTTVPEVKNSRTESKSRI